MPFNGSGTFTRNQDWTADRDAGSPNNIISATKMDDEDDNFKGGFDLCLTRDGQAVATANLPMGGFKHTGVADAVAVTEYAVTGQVQNSDYIDAGTSSGTDTVTAGLTPALTAYEVGQVFTLVVGGTNTGPITLNIDSVGALAVQKLGAALVAGDWTLNDVVHVRHDGTQLQMLSPARTPVLTAGSIATAAIADNAIDETKLKDALIADFTEVVVATGDSFLLGDTSDSGNTKRDTVQGVLDLVAADLLGKADTVITAADKIIFGDASDSDNPKTDTVQGVLDLVSTLTLDTPQATTSGGNFDFTGIPAGTKRITMNLDGVSLTGTDNPIIRLGDAGGFETTGYASAASNIGSTVSTIAITNGFLLNPAPTAARIITGSITFTLLDSSTFTWAAAGSGMLEDVSQTLNFGGSKSLSAELTQIQLTRDGSNTFDAGAVNITFE